ncbi:MAG: class I SAM-dependent methyltransferase, partial [Nitrososphaerales archaeon]
MSGTHTAETTSKITGYVIGAVKKAIPPSAQPGANRLFDRTTNAVESILGWREELTPPLRIRIHIGPFADPRLYRLAGDMNVEGFKDLAGLKPKASFLDIACGCGRVARALTNYFDVSAKYEGFDAAKKPVQWAQSVITAKFPNFHFRTADTFNKRYNPLGKTGASELIFPYEDDAFDFAFAGSLYTHMVPEEVTNFVRETKRVLKPGGTTVATYCLLNERTLPIVDAGKSMPRLIYKYGDCRVRTPKDPAHFIAHPEAWVRKLYEDAGLKIVEPIAWDTWAETTPESMP